MYYRDFHRAENLSVGQWDHLISERGLGPSVGRSVY